MSKTILATTFATFLCASLAAAQATQTPDPSSPRVAPPAAGGAAEPAQSQSRSAPSNQAITVEGCIARSTSSGATTGTTGTTGATPFTLNSATKPAGSTSTAPIASSYRLDADASKLTPHVGHRVEITGTLEPEGSSAGGAGMAPKLKVENVKMVAATCTP